MPFWKPLMFIVPAGLVLGMIGGNLARPEMVERAADAPWQAMFQSRAEREGGSTEYPAPTQGDLAYVGGYSYAPEFATRDAEWTPPAEDRLASGYVPLPTVAQLDARQAALLADPEVEFAVHLPSDVAGANEDPALNASQQAEQPDTQVASADRIEPGSEPQKADGEPAIW